MNKILPTPTRIKHERDVTVLLTTLSEHTTACEKRIAELEKALQTETAAANEHRRAARKMEQRAAVLQQRIDDGKGEVAAMATDLKLAKAAHKQLEKDAAAAHAATVSIEKQLAATQGEKEALSAELSATQAVLDTANADLAQTKAALADSRADIETYEATIAEYRETDNALRERIALLESQLSEERTKAGKDLLLRIMELETMLDAERNKVNDLQELPNMVRLETGARAANTTAVKTRRRVSGSGE